MSYRYRSFTTDNIRPSGWMKDQLRLQAQGLNGNLDKVWKDVRDSAWIGGHDEGWERVPYWLDGFIPLAYLLDDDDLKQRAKKYIDAILGQQCDDGWICPCTEEQRSTYDTWAVLLITKVLIVYYECSGDDRIPDAVYRVMKNYHDLLTGSEVSLFNWGKFRWFEGFIALNFLYERYGEDWIRDLARIIKEQGADYTSFSNLWKKPMKIWKFQTHIVNLCMMLKSEAVSCDLLGEDYTGLADDLYDMLYEYNGTPVGIITGDECLAGPSPIRGTELCGVVELMYSCEILYRYTGDSKWADLLEKIAFNALPAAISDDMWAHQYDQMSNQILCKRFGGNPVFGTNNQDSVMFGLEPNYGCCTANFGQGWPKFMLSAYAYNDEEIICAVPIPSVLQTEGVRIVLDTEYPFENTFRYTITSDRRFRFRIRIPEFAKMTVLNKADMDDGKDLLIDVDPGTSTYDVSYVTVPVMKKRDSGLVYIQNGSLIYSLPRRYTANKIEYTSCGVERKFPYCDYEYTSEDEWRYALSRRTSFRRIRNSDSDGIPFSSKRPPDSMFVTGARINWGFEEEYDNVCCADPGEVYVHGKNEELELIPYGCAKLRITEFPVY